MNLTAKLSVKNVLHDTPRCMQFFLNYLLLNQI